MLINYFKYMLIGDNINIGKYDLLEKIDFNNLEGDTMFSTLVKKEREKNISQGEIIGITKILKSKLKTLLTKKFEAISEEIISKIDNCNDIKRLENAIDNILDYTNSNEVLDILK